MKQYKILHHCNDSSKIKKNNNGHNFRDDEEKRIAYDAERDKTINKYFLKFYTIIFLEASLAW